jgi:hypothetical protein
VVILLPTLTCSRNLQIRHAKQVPVSSTSRKSIVQAYGRELATVCVQPRLLRFLFGQSRWTRQAGLCVAVRLIL